MLDVIRRVAPRMPPGAARETLRAQADAIREAAAAKVLVRIDLQDVETAWKRAVEANAPS
jgi:hypothetical protein